jgi:hypothetical protein
VIGGLEEPHGLALWVFDARPVVVCVTETVDVLDAEDDPVFVGEAVEVLLCRAEVEGIADTVVSAVVEYDVIDEGVGAGALVPDPEILSVVDPRIVFVMVAEPVLVFETDAELETVRVLVLVRVPGPVLV